MLNELDDAKRDILTASEAKHAALALFARRVAHDMNNFATVIRTYSELLMADLPPGSAQEDLGEIHRAADAMVAYLRHIARFSRIEAAKSASIAVQKVAREALADLEREEAGAPIVVEGSTDLSAMADAGSFSDVVRELTRNAREASPAGKPVVVQLFDEQATWVVLRVSDHGPGFHASVDGCAEDPFVTTKQGVRGAGFGLTLAAVFARHAGGKLVRERASDCTHVSLFLPVA